MSFLSLKTHNFRNLQNGAIDISAKEIYFVGENGQGKTNFLETLYFVSYGNSWRTHVDSQIVKNDEKNFALHVLYKNEKDSIQKIDVSFENGKKQIEKNGKKIKDRKELINTIPCVLFCHDDMKFAIGEPEWRRFFLDQSLALFNPLYLDDLRKYKKILKNRNQILKSKNYELLDAYDFELAKTGLEIQKKRVNAVFEFNQIFGNLYAEISGIENLSIDYISSWKKNNENEIVSHLFETRERDKIMETTLSGPHRDKIFFVKDKKNFIQTASTGQQRLVSLVLRASQAVFYTRLTNVKPVFLMDDVLLELDPDKRKKMTALLPSYEQLFCTFLPEEPYARYVRSSTKIFRIENGMWYDEN